MKILLCHNRYQMPGGEDSVVEAEADLLAARGHQVIRFERHNDDLKSMGKLSAFRKTLWNPDTVNAITGLIKNESPDVMHCANTFPLISPSAYHAAKQFGVAVVQTLHNYRLICPNAQLFRQGQVCTDCVGKSVTWPALLHGCYRRDRVATAAVSSMLAYHSLRGTWSNGVDRYIAISGCLRDKMTEGGLPANKIAVKPNFLADDPGPGSGSGHYALFVGRLSEEKGLRTLIEAWRRLPLEFELKVAGQGPLGALVRDAAGADSRITWLGHLPSEDVFNLMGEAKLLVMPSVWTEPFGLTVIEAYAKGTPVAASRIGALAELVREGETGFLFEPGNPADLSNAVQRSLQDPAALESMRERARAEFEARYTSEANYEQLLNIYRAAIEECRSASLSAQGADASPETSARAPV